jgi:hypothetical protein
LGRSAERQGGKGKQQHTAAAAENLEPHGLSPVGASDQHLYFCREGSEILQRKIIMAAIRNHPKPLSRAPASHSVRPMMAMASIWSLAKSDSL